MRYWEKKIHEMIKAMNLPEVDPAEVEDFVRATHDTFNYLEEDQLREEIRMAVFAIHSGILKETTEDVENYYGLHVGCEVPPGRTPPELGPEITPERIRPYLNASESPPD